MKNIVIIGGGTGTFTLLSALRAYPTENAVVVSTADDGGSTGRLREELGVMPMGDIRHCLSGLSYTDSVLADAFSYRFESGSLKGHVVGNILLASLEKVTGSIESAIIECAKLLNVRGQVVPATLVPTKLSATLDDGTVITGEHHIDEPRHDGNLMISSLSLTPDIEANPRAVRLIASADLIVFGPGDLYTSTVPNLLVRGIPEAVRQSPARTVLITNLMTKFGQTNGYSADDFLEGIERYLGASAISTVIVNTTRPTEEWIGRYKRGRAEFVQPSTERMESRGIRVIKTDLLSQNVFTKSCADPLARSYLRHDPEKIAKVLWEIIQTPSPAYSNA